jgi:hypothetical protein
MTSGIRIFYSKEELSFIKSNSKLPRKKLNELFCTKFNRNTTPQSIKAICLKNRWLTGRNGYFKKGSIPFNKGTKGLIKPNKTSFKKGNKPKNTLKIGDETVDCYGYKKTKIAEPNKWAFNHHILYKKIFGNIPENHLIIFKDGDKSNITIENLCAISQQENLWINKNGYSKMPLQFFSVIKGLAKLNVKIFETKKRNKIN